MTHSNAERTQIINDLAEDCIKIMQYPEGTKLICGVCDRMAVGGYLVWTHLPSTMLNDDRWHRWDRVCWQCMAMIVGAGGVTLPAERPRT